MTPRQYFQIVPAVHLFLRKDNQVLLLRRYNTGYRDGEYSVPAGHLNGDEKATKAMVREAKEEATIDVNPDDLKLACVMHRKAEEERIDFFFEARKWQGEIKIGEKNKCDDLRWFDLDELPENIVPYIKKALGCYRKGEKFVEFGWVRVDEE